MTIKQLICESCKKFQEKIAFTIISEDKDIKISYLDFLSDIYRTAFKLIQYASTRSTIFLWGKNSYEWILIYCAAIFCGHIVVPLEKDLNADEVNLLAEQLERKFIIYDDEYIDIQHRRISVPIKSFREVLEKIDENDLALCVKKVDSILIDESDPAMIINTSGTTSTSKKVVLLHSNITSNIIAIDEKIELCGRGLLLLPLSHMYSLTAAMFTPLYSGAENIISRHIRFFIREVETYNPDFIFLVPDLVDELYHALKKKKAVNEKHMMIFCGGASLPNEMLDKFEAMHVTLLNGYGMTECSPVISTNTLNESRRGSVGTALKGLCLKIHEPNEENIGELYIKGDSVMKGYLNNPLENSKSFDGEWFKTGDIVRIDEDGYIFIEGRAKNIILTGNGENIYPEELEGKLLQYQEIKEVLVYQKNKKIVAEIYPDVLHIKSDINECICNIVNNLNFSLPYYKRIGEIIIREKEFEKSGLGKIIRK